MATDSIPRGFCECGCGGMTRLAPQTHTKSGWVKGQPLRFIGGHQTRLMRTALWGDRSPAERFAAMLRREPNGCLIYTGAKQNGYGWFRFRGTSMKAHRVAWLLAGNRIPADKPYILHSCDNRACCETSHLRVGTHAENMVDMALRGGVRTSARGLPFGVSTKQGSYAVTVKVDGRMRYFGSFESWAVAGAVALYIRNLRLFPLQPAPLVH